MTEEPETPEWEAIIRIALQGALAGVRTTLPGRITAYDATKQMASVQPLIREARVDETGVERYEDLPQIHSVPVMFVGPPVGRITWPVRVGDLCALWFASSSLDQWILRGTTSTVDPRDPRHHDLNDAIAMVGLHSPGAPPTPAPTDAIVHHAGAGVTIKLGGPDANHALALQGVIDQLNAAIDTASTAVGAPANAWGVALRTALSNLGWPVPPNTGPWSSSTIATKVKAK